MGSSSTESKTPVSSMEFEQETTAYPNLKMRSSTNKKLTTSSSNVSSSPDSPLDDPFHDDNKSSSSSSSSPNHKTGKTPSSKNTVPKPEPSKTEAPPVQVMEQHSTSSYRIPSSVFANSKSKAAMEWSVASNDSLFSIHTGNMSFTNDYYSFRMRELGEPGEASMSSGDKVGKTRSRELGGVDEAKMKGAIRESEDWNCEKSMDERCLSHRSDKSNVSTQSFAFPILAGDVQNGASMRMGPKRQQSKPEPCAKPEPEHPACTAEPKSPVAAGNAGASNLCFCFPCRSFF